MRRSLVSPSSTKKSKLPKGQKRGAGAKKAKAAAAAVGTINAWETDPGSGNQPTGGSFVQRPVPTLSLAPLPTKITNPAVAPPPGQHAPDTAPFRYWAAAEALRRSSAYWGDLLPGVQWEVGATLPVDLDRGVDLNAFYDRVGLRFFHAPVAGRTVFSGESPDVVCHELGHAVLDSIKPQLWDAASIEIAAFHESFGDISAILSALQLPSLRHAVLLETGGFLDRASRLSRLAEQLGWAIRQSRPTDVEADCLRSAVNSFFYRDPNTLPTDAPATSLSSEPHSFSRVFTGAFFEGLAGMFKARPAQDEDNLLQASQDMGQILTEAIQSASVVASFYSQVAANVLQVAQRKFAAQGYEQPLRSAFVRHGVLPPGSAFQVASAHSMAAAAGVAAANIKGPLPQVTLSVAEYGLGIDFLNVAVAAQPAHFNVAGAAMAVGAIAPPAQDETAKAFLEDLLRRGRLKVVDGGKRAEILRAGAPVGHETHTHEIQIDADKKAVLRRVRIACNCFSRSACVDGVHNGEIGRAEDQDGAC